MKALRLFALLVFLCVPAVAGDIQNPGAPAPPPCTENCGAPSFADDLLAAFLFLVL